VIKTILVRHDSNVAKAIQEHERSKLVPRVTINRHGHRPEASCTFTPEVDSGFVEDAPDKS
jgi:hypothetical protein